MNTMPEIDELLRKPGHLIRLVHQRSVALFSELTRVYGVTPVQHVVMVALQRRPGIDLSTLARLVSLDKSTTGGVISRLAEAGLVHIAPSESDRRAKCIALTEKGIEIVDGMGEVVTEYQGRLLDPLEGDERLTFLAALRTLARGRSLRQRRTATPPESGEVEPPRLLFALCGETTALLEAVAVRLHGAGRSVRLLQPDESPQEQERLVMCRVISKDVAAPHLAMQLADDSARVASLCAAPGSVAVLALFIRDGADAEPAECAQALRVVWTAGVQRFFAASGCSCSAVVTPLVEGSGEAGLRAGMDSDLDAAAEAIACLGAMTAPETRGVLIDLSL
ncbi:MAG: MarR family transcriptional regulator [Rhodobacteraceae bacterium]|nr:MarR family transcriptional regulator [Paracoccaceae bacterium]